MYYVGVDGGGTHARVCVLDESQTIIGIGKSGPSSIDTVEINQTIQAIESGLEDVFSQNSVKDKVIKSIFIGLGGVLTNQSKVLVKHSY